MVRSPIYQDPDPVLLVNSCLPPSKAFEEGKLRLAALGRGPYPGKRLGAHSLPGVCTMGTMQIEGNQVWGQEWHRNEGIKICFLESGKLPLMVEDRTYTLQWNDLWITRPWQLYRLGDPRMKSGRLHYILLDVGVRRPDQDWQWPGWVFLEDHDLRQLTAILRQTEALVWQASPAIRQCFQRIGQGIESYANGSHDSHLKIYLNDLLLLLLDLLRAANTTLNPQLSGRRHTVELFLHDLAQNLDSIREDWTLETMAGNCGLSPSSFARYCKDLTNLTPVSYLIRCRIDRASRMLLESPRRNITDIAFETGFNSSQYFATVFRRHFKCSPCELRAQADPGAQTRSRPELPVAMAR